MNNKDSNGKISIRKIVEKDGIRKEFSCRQVENGFVIEVYKSWSEGEEYKSDSKTYISKDNPFDKTDKKVDKLEKKSKSDEKEPSKDLQTLLGLHLMMQ